MFNNAALDISIGLVFVFLLYSLLATILHEIIATQMSFRSKVLEKAILRMLEDGRTTTPFPFLDRIKGYLHIFGLKNELKDKVIAPWFFAHPTIKYLSEDNHYSKPAYLDAKNFSRIMIDLLQGSDRPESELIQSIHSSVMNGSIFPLPIPLTADAANPAIKVLNKTYLNNGDNTVPATININPQTALHLKFLWRESGADIEKFKTKLEKWYDDTMERATGWYKRYTQVFLFFIGLILAVNFNVDTIKIGQKLAKEPKAREQMVQSAMAYMERNKQLETHMQFLPASIASKETTPKLIDTPKTSLDSNKNVTDSAKAVQIARAAAGNIITKDSAEKVYDSLVKRTNLLLDSAKNLANGDIKNASDVLGLGYTTDVNFFKRLFCFNSYDDSKNAIWGWLLTALAISLGAPFWFDLLSKLVKVRGAGTKIEGDPAATGTGNIPGANNPVIVNVNPNSGEEAVG